jgi:dihydroorotate dehydrogenase
LNLGCPNVHEYGIDFNSLEQFCRHYWCGVKLPADLRQAFVVAEQAVLAGVRYLHAGNTLPSERGGISGHPLKFVNLQIVEALAKMFSGINVNIVGGGGIYSFDDLIDYRNAGANSYSLATVWFKPWRARKIMRQYERLYGT